MDTLSNILHGLAAASQPANLLYCFLGVVLGTAIGVLPGLGPVATIAMLLPMTYALDPTAALIMLAGIYYGAQYGGSTTAILVNLPGEASSVVTAIDGHAMAKQGRGGAALAIAALASVFAGTVATGVLAVFSPILSSVALSFLSPDYFSLVVLGLVASVVLANASMLKAFGMVLVGLVLGSVGIDPNSGEHRFTFGVVELSNGLEFVAIAMGMFAFAEIVQNVSDPSRDNFSMNKLSRLWPSKQDFRRASPAAARGTLLGSVFGVLPGGGAAISSFVAYALERKVAKHPEEFGNGAVEGVAGPEAANNAAAQTSFIPMLTLGIPSNGVMALMMGAMMIHNIAPGPQVMTNNSNLVWALIASMWIGNLILVVLNLPLVGLWVKLVSVPYRYLAPAIMTLCVVGLYGIGNEVFPIYVGAAFAIFGYMMAKLKCEPAPLLLGFILGPMLEENLRRSLLISDGDVSVFFTRPISVTLLTLAAVLLISVAFPSLRRKRREVMEEGEG
ncbi:tripartite tricarboxylate transporter permease [Ensifer sp. ENS05]|uniref:tripartite tricarboxylate transporter permease n=1 Tax=Ensifer sp. ENS05 TaxID=2769277 RepID=UPI001784DC3F|nr:tripartite tricarboxylate transporter permease [Ensifer sp. ENS05]MBD9597304.1 tripartite tricarboxylate transporter permease [Ensifer sp. ENS05]